MDSEESALIRKAQQGERQAFDQIVRRYDQRVLRLAYDICGNLEDAKDIYQEVFLRVFRQIAGFRFQSEFTTWLYRVTLNCAISYRRRRRPPAPSLETWEGAKSLVHRGSDPQQEAEGVDFRMQLEHALGSLSPKERSVFVLRHYHGHKLTEIAEILDTKIGTVKNYLFRATQKIRQQLVSYPRD
ncbi:MAG: RNA polymerase sigma factor [bacterium]|jgi:RNA polymerase sigma-70 factor (ECF subfamily)|nr:RNA polymerase sigma factor [candidate division KSB1 bacterium]MDH7560246.1 RNA polymerase sigma factor [bacterium]